MNTKPTISTSEAAALIPEASTRQLDDWANRLWFGDHLDGRGSGTRRQWEPVDVLRARALARAFKHLGGGKELRANSLLEPLAERLQQADIGELLTSVVLVRGPLEIRVRLWLDDTEIGLAEWVSDHTEFDLTAAIR